MSILRPSTALAAALVVSPAAAQTTQRATPMHEEVSLSFEGTISRPEKLVCPVVEGRVILDSHDGTAPDTFKLLFDGQHFQPTNDPDADSALSFIQGKISDMCSEKRTYGVSEKPVPISVQASVAADAIVVPQKNGCLLGHFTATSSISFSIDNKATQFPTQQFSFGTARLTQTADYVIISAQGKNGPIVESINRSEVQGIPPTKFGQACGLK